MNELKRIIASIKPHEAVVYLIGYAAVIVSIFIANGAYIESAASLFFLTGTILNAKRSRAWFAFSSIGMILYSYVAFHNRFYSELIINAFYMVPMQIYGFINWGKSKEKRLIIEVETLPAKKFILYLLCGAAVTLIYGWLLTFIGNSSPYIGAASTVCSALAVMFAARRIMHQFLFWIANNLCIIAMWILSSTSFSGLPIIVVNAVFVVMNAMAFATWRRLYYILKD